MTNNLISNLLVAGTQRREPAVGDGATVAMYTDRHAYTIVAVRAGKDGLAHEIDIRADKVTRTDGNGMSDSQAYDYAPGDADWPVQTWRKDQQGRWRRVIENDRGRLVFANSYKDGDKLIIGRRDHFYDFSF